MSKNIKSNHKHLLLSDRIYIEQSLYQRKTLRSIAIDLGKDPTTISKEIKRFVEWNDGRSAKLEGNDCKNYFSCQMEDLCMISCGRLCKDCSSNKYSWFCPNYVSSECSHLKKAPYVCNGCPELSSCNFSRYYYSAQKAHERYQNLLVESRSGINTDPETFQKLNNLISPLIRNGQPLSHVFATHKGEIPCSRKTIYNYLDQGLFDVRNIDLPRRVRYKLRKKHRFENPIQYDYRIRRSYKDFEKYTEAFPDYEVIEMDTVKGSRDAGKCLLTLLFRRSNFMLIFLLPSCTQKAVLDVFNYLYEELGSRTFKTSFRILLTDNGPEFKDPWSIEKSP